MTLTFAQPFTPKLVNNDLALVAAHKAASAKQSAISGTEKMTPELRALAGWITEYATQQKITWAAAMKQVFEFLKRDRKSLAYYPGGRVAFAESAASHQSRLDALGSKLSQVEKLTPSEAKALSERNAAIGEAKKYHGIGNNYKIPDGVVLSEDEVDLLEWIMTYADMKKLPFKEAMDHIFSFLKSTPDDLKKYTSGDISFAETSGRPFSVPRGFSVEPDALGHLRRLHIYQAGTGCSFMKAAQELGIGGTS